MCRQGQLSPRTCFGGRDRECSKSPVDIIDAKSGHLDPAQTQVNETEGDGVVASALIGPAVEGRQKLSPLVFIKVLGKSLAAEIRDGWHSKHHCGRALASQDHEAKKLPQDREDTFDALGAEQPAPGRGIATQIVCTIQNLLGYASFGTMAIYTHLT